LVNPLVTIGLIVIAGIIFLNVGGIGRASALVQDLKKRAGSGAVSVPSTQSGEGSVPIKTGSQAAVNDILSVKASTAPVVERRKFGTGITTREAASSETLRKLTSFAGTGVAQFSGGIVGGLSAQQLGDIRSREFTSTEQSDIKALELRRTSAIERGISPNIKLSGEELVLRKREQEALSKQLLTERFGSQTFVNGKLFAKAGFESGGLTPELAAERLAAAQPTIGKEGQIIENLGEGGGAIIKARTESRVSQAIAFNEAVARAKAAGEPLPTFAGFTAGTGAGGTF